MALQENITLDNGLQVNDAYARIGLVAGNKTEINISLFYYLSKSAYLENKTPLKEENESFPPDVSETGKNFIKQGYEYIKTLPQHSGAIDLLDEGQTA